MALRWCAAAMDRNQLDAEAVKKSVEPAFGHGRIPSLQQGKFKAVSGIGSIMRPSRFGLQQRDAST